MRLLLDLHGDRAPLEHKVRVTPWGRLASSMAALQDFLPRRESTRVMHYEIWQDLHEHPPPTPRGTRSPRSNAAARTTAPPPIPWTTTTVPRLPRVARGRSRASAFSAPPGSFHQKKEFAHDPAYALLRESTPLDARLGPW